MVNRSAAQLNAALVAKLADILGTQDDEEFVQKVQNNYDFLLNLRVQYNDQVLTADLSLLSGHDPRHARRAGKFRFGGAKA